MMGTSHERQRAPRKDQQRNRSALIAAARDVFATRGINAPLDLIARTAGVSGATLYRHFPERRQLIASALLVSLRRHEDVIERALEHENGWDGLRSYLSWLWEEQLNDIAFLSALREVSAGRSAEVDRLRQLTADGLSTLLDRAQAQGQVRTDRGIEDLLLFIHLNDQLSLLPREEAVAASRRLYRLAIDSIAVDPSPPDDVEPPEVLTLRRTLLHEVAGFPPGTVPPRHRA